ncbi:Nn.00g018220.m01.CDS01 [Neocucurbitaria sp. VM-36]
MRSSVACDKCRKSKTKCENSGINTVCKACAHTKRECVYGPSTALVSGGSMRRESTAGEGDTAPRKRRKPLAPHSSLAERPTEGLGTYEDALSSPLLTPQVWKELFAIYEKHFAIDFPFLHKQRFLSPLQPPPPGTTLNKTAESSSSPRPKLYPPLLLAFLTQTARFHPTLVAQKESPIATAHFYAQATRVQMGHDVVGKPTLEKIQALLMLACHEWTDLKGSTGWMKMRTAISAAQLLKYQWDADNDDNEQVVATEGDNRQSEKNRFIDREIERRTFWSCCLLDRYLSWGKNRPQMLRSDEMKRIQLVCSDRAFDWGLKCRTRLLGEDDAAYAKRRQHLRESAKSNHHKRSGDGRDQQPSSQFDHIRWEVGDQEAELSWYIQVVDHLGEIIKWSCAGGRRQEGSTPPWDEKSTFRRLDVTLKRLKRDLPEQLQLTPENTQIRLYNGPADKYLLIHAMCMMCTVWLYREYMPLSPWTLKSPQGPLDDPLISETPPEPDYWVNQAKDCFGACKDFANLLHSLHDVQAETPTMAFATYTVAWSAIYCFFHPSMDPDGALDTRPKPNAWDIANVFLGQMARRFSMARDWQLKLKDIYKYYQEERAKYKKAGGDVGGSPQSSTSDGGGGLKDYVQFFEKSHKEFGLTDDNINIDDKDVDMTEIKIRYDTEAEDRTETASSVELKSEKRDSSEGMTAQTVPVSPAFTPVNAKVPTLRSISAHEMTSLPKTPPSTYGPQLLNQHTPAESSYSFASHNSSYMSPPTHGYSYSTAHSSHHNISGTRGNVDSTQVQMFPSGAGTGFHNWPPQSLTEMVAAKRMIEETGTQSMHNDYDLGIMAMGDGEDIAFQTERPFTNNSTTNYNNATFYAPYHGQPQYYTTR